MWDKRIIRKGTNGIGNRFKEYVYLKDGVILIHRLIFVPFIAAEQYAKESHRFIKLFGKDCLMYKSFAIKVNSIKEILTKLDIE